MKVLEEVGGRIALLFEKFSVLALRGTPESMELMSYYNYLTGQLDCITCWQNVYPALLDLKKNYLHLIKEKMKANSKKYQFKEGVSFRFFNESTLYTNENLDDEIAKIILEANPENKYLFEGFEEKKVIEEFLVEEDTIVVVEKKAKK